MNCKVSGFIKLLTIGFLALLSNCHNQIDARDSLLASDMLVLNQNFSKNNIRMQDVYILLNIDCGSCLEDIIEIEEIIVYLIGINKNVSLVLNGENLSFFVESFQIYLKDNLTVYYDRYDTFRKNNLLVDKPYTLLVFKKPGGRLKTISLAKYISKNKKRWKVS